MPDKHRIFVPQQGQRLYERVSCVCSGRGRRQNPRRLQNRFGGNNQSSRIKGKAALQAAFLTNKKTDLKTVQTCFFRWMRQRLSLPGRVRPSTFRAEELNFCVRDENRWDLLAIATAMVYSAFCIKAKQPEISSCCPQRTLTTA